MFYTRWHKELQSKKEAKIHKHEPLLSVFILWQQRVNEALCSYTAAGKEPIQVSAAQLHPHHAHAASDPPRKH